MNRTQELASLFLRQPPPPVSDWLEQNIRLPAKFSRTPGPVSFAGRRFMRMILDLWHPEAGVTHMNVAAGTQLAKTTMLMLGQAYRIRNNPTSTLIVGPSRDFCRDVLSGERLRPLIDHNPILSALKPDDMDSYKALDMAMKGGHISLVGANSPGQLSGRTRGMVLQDEVCKFEVRTSEQSPESHPMLLADERTKDYGPTAFHYKSSSPNSPHHPFWQEQEAGTQTCFYVPCPECGDGFEFAFEKDGDYRSLEWDPNAKDSQGLWIEDKVKESTRYICPHCAFPISTHKKAWMLDRVEMVDRNPGASRRKRSFHIPSFYSPSITFGDMAVQFLKGLEMFGLQNYYNSWLALPWSEISVRLEDEDITALKREDFRRGQFPQGTKYIILTADPGEISGVHWMASAVTANEEIFVCDWGVELGIENLAGVAQNLMLTEQGTGKQARANIGLTDSRYNSEKVYDLCARSAQFWHPTRGSDMTYGAWTENTVTSHPGLKVFVFVDLTLKSELYGRRISKREEPFIWLPIDADQTLISQLSGQQFDSRTNRWKRLQHDHLGDCLKQVVLFQWINRSYQLALRKAL